MLARGRLETDPIHVDDAARYVAAPRHRAFGAVESLLEDLEAPVTRVGVAENYIHLTGRWDAIKWIVRHCQPDPD